jgi:hypothetical protein
MKHPDRILALLIGAIVLAAAQTASAQSERLGVVSYTPVAGWTKTVKGNIVTFSVVDQAAGRFCFITLYGAAPGTGGAASDFKREWNNLVVKPFQAPESPKTETEKAGVFTITGGASPIEFQGNKALAVLTVISDRTRTVSILGILNHDSYLPQFVAFSTSIDIAEAVAETPSPRHEAPIQPAPAAMNVNALAREFQDNEVRANQTWLGKRVRVTGVVNSIQIVRDGHIELTFKTSVTNYNMAKCHFNKSQSGGVATLSAHTEATVDGTVRGLGGGFDNTKSFFVLEDCTVP